MAPLSLSIKKSNSKYPLYPSLRNWSPKSCAYLRALRRIAGVKVSAKISLPHHPPLYGVNSLKPTSSVINGVTIVPCRVTQASKAAPRQLMRFITLHSFSASISLAYLS